MSTVISIENVSKFYRLGAIGGATLRDDFSRWWAQWRGLPDPLLKVGATNFGNQDGEFIWALRDISFSVNQGEVIGIIGRNGAGKSTLLKILSKVTAPTSGKIFVRGRIASLLEVGTGFHPELTGRENIYMNGSILGMGKSEIDKKLEEIIEFAEISKFIDTPVKRYSSGMYVRLAFAVAAHLDPEILIVDEVLAVGDFQFQKKCLGKMQEAGRGGRTVLFVSHNIGAIKALCQKAAVLSQGRLLHFESVDSAVEKYLKSSVSVQRAEFPVDFGDLILHDFFIQQNEVEVDEVDGGKPIFLGMKFELLKDLTEFRIGFIVKTTTGEVLLRSLLTDWNPNYVRFNKGVYEVKGEIPPNYFTQGQFFIVPHSSRFGITDFFLGDKAARQITINSPDDFNLPYVGERPFGWVILNPNWNLKVLENG